MTDLFLDILNTSFAASWVVLAVILVRLALKKAPRWMVCGLWALVALRLLMPLMPEASFSMIPSSEIIPPQSLYDAAPVIDSGVGFIDNAVNPVYCESLRPMPGASVNPLQVWMAVFANIWVLGMGAMAVWAAVSCLRVRRQIRERIRLDGNVYLCDRVESPFIFGLLRPIICLPSGLDEGTRGHVIAHERSHLARRDHWWKPIGFLLLTVNWFNPLMWAAYILLCRDIEMACDERVARRLGVEQKKAYSSALLQCSIRQRYVTVCPLAFGEVGVKMRVKSVLHYKKPAFWVILVTAVVIAVLGLGLLTNPESDKPEIRFDGLLYVQEGWPVRNLPEDAEPAGSLASTLHDSTPHPNANSQAVGLEWEYAGQSLYLDGNTLYLEQPGSKGWLPFELKHSFDDLKVLMYDAPQCDIILRGGKVSILETLPQDVRHQLRDLLCTPGAIEPLPYADWSWSVLTARDAGDRVITIQDRDYALTIYLTRREADWLMVIQDSFQSGSAWTFESPELDAFLSQWEAELTQAQTIFSDYATGEAPVWLDYHSMDMDQLTLRFGNPTHIYNYGTGLNWEWEGRVSHLEKTMCLSCRPEGREYWMEIWYYNESAEYSSSIHQSQAISWPNGVSGTLHYVDDPNRWEVAQLNTDVGQLAAKKDWDNDWTNEEHRLATDLLSTISLSYLGSDMMTVPNRLGISLTVQNASSQGLNLVCIQQGNEEDLAEIVTGSEWAIHKWEDGAWVSIMPQDIAWPEIMHLVNLGSSTTWSIDVESVCGKLEAGRYRIAKTFYGHPHPDDIKSTTQAIEQRCYAEFDINPLGISLRAADVSPNGLTLLCTQDGTLWTDITTGSAWTLEQWGPDGWVSIMPEETVWTAIAYLVNQNSTTQWNIRWNYLVGELGPGRYRIGKHFTGERRPPVTLNIPRETYEQMCYAEFTIQ